MNEDLVIESNRTILEALKRLNSLKNISRLILFVVENNKVVGSITDGDIRRSILNDSDLNKKVIEICNTNFIFKEETNGYIDLKSDINENLKILPILFKDKTLSRIIDLDKIKSIIPVECVIMAGGRGKRLSPLTDNIPKPMLKLGSKPIIEHNIDNLISFGIKKFYISINYLGNLIKDYFGDGSSKGIEIIYIQEDTPLGTAGSLTLISKFKYDKILLINSDLFTNVNIEKMYLNLFKNNSDMVIASSIYKVDIPFAIFEENSNTIHSFKEKPTFTYPLNAGIYLFKKNLISLIPSDLFFDITDLMKKAMENNYKLTHEPILGFWIDIGSPTDLKRANELMKTLN
tara:strand:+ start:4003 stop:5040 length:1038 start_codon:yes stop_codon:yes gene_type:complete